MREDIEIKTKDGVAKAALFRSDFSGAASDCGVLFYMDATGLRPSLYAMAERMADAGYVVLMPDLFYRYGSYGPFTGKSFGVPELRNQILGMLRDTTQEMTRRDNEAFFRVLADAGAAGPVAAVGYCMGGGRAISAAGDFPGHVLAAASFHGGDLASGREDSPHMRAPTIKGRVYVGVAGVDSSFPPEQSARLAEALRVAEVDHIIENYVGMGHGWTVSDHGTYNEVGAERHWKRLLQLLEETFV